jgi:hypothetical protein
MSPAHHSGQGRLVVIGLVLAALVGLAVVTRTPGVAEPGGPPLTPAAFVAAPGAESSAWFCTGQSVVSGVVAVGTLILTNTTGLAVTGAITQVSDAGATSTTEVTVPPHAQLLPPLPNLSPGSWAAATVVLSRGGVAVTQAVHGSAGWSETPCVSRTSEHWYFPSGTTSGSDGLFISLFNPTSTPDVVDLTFITPSGSLRPINFEGIVVPPGGLEVANVSAYVQNQSTVSTDVSSRTGRVVAAEVQEFNGGSNGLALVGGSPLAESHWSIPLSEEAQGANAEIDVFNPGSTTEQVSVQANLGSGPLSPLTHAVAPLTTWALTTSQQTRIPKGDDYSSTITATGGAGVVVGRSVMAPSSSAQAPQAGLANAIGDLSASWPSDAWVVPSPGSTAMPAYSGSIPEHVTLDNPTTRTLTYLVDTMTPSHTRQVVSGHLRPGATVAIGGATLFKAGLYPLLVTARGPLAVSEDLGPAGMVGVVTMPGIALASN